ncbi:hypothetical protein AVEN_104319-1 [Araneus ventricosus]|uniref:Reverse transcriptase domain-containing protein n=1 Tax=Araneus ventricosus TaxID=182803 RepID=A0A4Y2BV59_ARAVE|nr:hypothetical protein AVEN_104319-1 [Araneus ventricosus]
MRGRGGLVILLRRLNHTLKKKNLLHHNQFGFREVRSTDDAIHQLVEKIQDAKNKKLHTMVISLDIQGAFDHLQYNSIRNSLDEVNFHSHTIEPLKTYLIIGRLPSKQPKAQSGMSTSFLHRPNVLEPNGK